MQLPIQSQTLTIKGHTTSKDNTAYYHYEFTCDHCGTSWEYDLEDSIGNPLIPIFLLSCPAECHDEG